MTAFPLGATVVVVVLAAGLGARLGGRRVGRMLALVLASWLAGIGACAAAWHLAWFRPFGLVTPPLLGICVLLLLGVVLPRTLRAAQQPPGGAGRLFGSVLGAACGLYLAAVGWLLACAATAAHASSTPAADVAFATAPAATSGNGDALHELLQTVNHGFVRHLPLLGDLSDELEALRFMLAAPPSAQRRYVQAQGWHDLADLRAYRLLVADETFCRDFEALRTGDLLALYRVQQNPRFVAFFRCARVQKLLPGLRPSTMAAGLRATGLDVDRR